jgi:hypothetical protein
MTTEPINDIDFLMSLDPLELSKQDIDIIIAYHRNQRALREKGVKPKKDKGLSTAIDLIALGLKPAAPKINRRV